MKSFPRQLLPFPDPPPSVAEYISGFRAIAFRVTERQLTILNVHYHLEGRTGLDFHQVAERCGYKDYRGVNREYGVLAKRLLTEMGYAAPPWKKDGSPFWLRGIQEKGGAMRPEVALALEEVGLIRGIVVNRTEVVPQKPNTPIQNRLPVARQSNKLQRKPLSGSVEKVPSENELPTFPKASGKTLRVLTWNCRSAFFDNSLWDYFLKLDPDVALLQDVRNYPPAISNIYTIRENFARHKKGHDHHFKTLLLAKGQIEPLDLAIGIDWIDKELEHFAGNLIAGRVFVPEVGQLNIVSVYSPHWHIPGGRLENVDFSGVKQSMNKDIWLADLVLAVLTRRLSSSNESWIVGGDFNNCETFSKDCKEYLGKMSSLGLIECLRGFCGQLTPTFRHQRGIARNQLDYIFVTKILGQSLLNAQTPPVSTIFEHGFSDHSPIIADFDIRQSTSS